MGRHFKTKSKARARAFINSHKGKGFYIKKLKNAYGIYKD